jgi:GntR family transcriptional repressor for pyruvate dehydrogenase complex
MTKRGKTTAPESRVEAVHRHLLGAISRGEFPAGSRLPSETELASMLDVSRPVIREAVSRLSVAGMVRAEQGRGTFVSERPVIHRLDFSPIEGVEDLIEWQDFRIAVEQENAMLAAMRHGPKDLEKIKEIQVRLVELPPFGDRAINLDFDFHVAIAEATQNPILVNAQQSLGEHIRSWMSVMLQTKGRPQSSRQEFRDREHQAIIDAIERRDPYAAAQAARRHLENGRTRLLAEISVVGAGDAKKKVRAASPT